MSRLKTLVWPSAEAEPDARWIVGKVATDAGSELPETHAQIHDWYLNGVSVMKRRRPVAKKKVAV